MATDRKSYFLVGDSVWRESWSLETKGLFVNLCGLLNERWARDGLTPEQACRVTLRDTLLMAITQSTTLSCARRRLSVMASCVSLEVSTKGRETSIYWPKYSDFQRYRSRTSGQTRGSSGPPHPHPHPLPPKPPKDPSEREGATGPEPTPKTPVPAALQAVERFVDRLHREEARRKLPLTRVSHLARSRLHDLAVSIGDYGPADWETRAVNAVERRIRSGASDCSVVWTGRDREAVLLRLDQLVSGPGWNNGNDGPAPADSAPPDRYPDGRPLSFDDWCKGFWGRWPVLEGSTDYAGARAAWESYRAGVTGTRAS